jgi:hypothetical protein
MIKEFGLSRGEFKADWLLVSSLMAALPEKGLTKHKIPQVLYIHN